MNDLPKEGLRALVAQEGVALLGDPERVRTLLRERFPQFPEEVEALARVLEEGVLESLTQSPEVSRDLETRTGLSREHILWGVQGWMDALPPEAVPGPSAPELRASVSGDLPVSRSPFPGSSLWRNGTWRCWDCRGTGDGSLLRP